MCNHISFPFFYCWVEFLILLFHFSADDNQVRIPHLTLYLFDFCVVDALDDGGEHVVE